MSKEGEAYAAGYADGVARYPSREAAFDASAPSMKGLDIHSWRSPMRWIPFNTGVEFLRERLMTTNPDYVLNNWECKYMDVRVDMRTGNMLIRPGNRASAGYNNVEAVITNAKPKAREGGGEEVRPRSAGTRIQDNKASNARSVRKARKKRRTRSR